MTINAYIFARAGSKGLAGKNKRLLDGVPLWVHSVRAAREAGIYSHIYVSTDDTEIANGCARWGAELIIRPHALATDDAPEWLSWQHALKHSAACDMFMSVPPTCPMRSSHDLLNTACALVTEYDAAVTVTPAQHNPFFVACVKDERGFRRMFEGRLSRRQDAPEVLNVCGVAYAARPSFVLAASGLWDARINPVLVPQERALDIDTPHDFEIAAALLAAGRRAAAAAQLPPALRSEA